MPQKRDERVARRVETEIEIDAEIGEVWKALTDENELKRWWPLDARVVQGSGGSEALDLQITVEIRDISRAAYFKVPGSTL